MPNPILRPFRSTDVVLITNRDGSSGLTEVICAQATQGVAWTAEIAGRPIGCGGVIPIWSGMAVCWLLFGEEICRYPVWITRTVRRLVGDLTRVWALTRLEAVVLETSVRNQRWLESLGFTLEQNGIARAYLPDHRSMIRYERIENS